jgi:hypothetical protein
VSLSSARMELGRPTKKDMRVSRPWMNAHTRRRISPWNMDISGY